MANKKVVYGLVMSALIVMVLAFTASQRASTGLDGATLQSVVRSQANGTVNTTFTENTLPLGSVFKVKYNNITKNTTNQTIVFATPAGTYPFDVYNTTVGNSTYVPSPASGSLKTGSTKHIKFSKK